MEKLLVEKFCENINDKPVEAVFKHLKFEWKNDQYVATLIDQNEYEIIKGYGGSVIEAINDLHSNLI